MYTLPKYHAAQRPLINLSTRFLAAACGTKFGKTYGCSLKIVYESYNNPNHKYWWIAPIYRQTKIGYRRVRRLLPRGTFEERKADLQFQLINGTVIEFRSAEKPEYLEGEAINGVICDEAGIMGSDVFPSVLTTLTQTNGWAILIGTPRGRGWFHKAYIKGQDASFPEWSSINLPTSANPFVRPEIIEEARKNLSPDLFRQYYLAEFLQDVATVFININECAIAEPQTIPYPARQYIIAYDPAKRMDNAGIIIFDTRLRAGIHVEAIPEQPYTVQADYIEKLSKKWNNASVIMDITGVGDAICDMLIRKGIAAEGYLFNNLSKMNLIENLVVAMANNELSYIPYPQLLGELNIFEKKVNLSGRIIYGAPSGYHDDLAIALALGNYKLQTSGVLIDFSTELKGYKPHNPLDDIGDF